VCWKNYFVQFFSPKDLHEKIFLDQVKTFYEKIILEFILQIFFLKRKMFGQFD